MATIGSTRPDDEWADDETDPMEDELILDEYDVDDELPERPERPERTPDHVPHWRLIEMSREDKSLRWAMADFEDYDDFEDLVGP